MIKHHWQSSYLALNGRVELIPISWIETYKLPNRADGTNDTEFNFLPMHEFSECIKEEGLMYPAVLEISRSTKKVRLVAGNHRIVVLSDEGLEYMPTFVAIIDEFDFNGESEDGFETDDLTDVVDATNGFNIEPPSKVFKSLSSLKYQNKLPYSPC